MISTRRARNRSAFVFAKSARVFAILPTNTQKRAIMQPSEYLKADKYSMEVSYGIIPKK